MIAHLAEFLILGLVLWFIFHAFFWVLLVAYNHKHPMEDLSADQRAARAAYQNRVNWFVSLGALALYTLLALFA